MPSLRDKANLNSKNKKLQFCPYCGAKLIGNARFCTVCGEKITVDTQEDTSSSDDYSSQDDSRDEYSYRFTSQSGYTDNTDRQRNKSTRAESNKRETVYEGKLHKCPNCGEVLDSYTMRCPVCGYEIRDTKSVSSVQELADKLEQISAQKMDSRIIFSREKRTQEFNREKESEKASMIKNFAIPNTKEDILEFVILAASNITSSDDNNGEVTKAWKTKLEQAYRKAKAVMQNQPEFDQVQELYDETIKKSSFRNAVGWIIIVAMADVYFLILGILGVPALTVICALILIGLAVLTVVLYRRSRH